MGTSTDVDPSTSDRNIYRRVNGKPKEYHAMLCAAQVIDDAYWQHCWEEDLAKEALEATVTHLRKKPGTLDGRLKPSSTSNNNKNSGNPCNQQQPSQSSSSSSNNSLNHPSINQQLQQNKSFTLKPSGQQCLNNSTPSSSSSPCNNSRNHLDLSNKLGNDGKLTTEECKHRFNNNLCMFCRIPGHIVANCCKKQQAAGKTQAHKAETTPKESEK